MLRKLWIEIRSSLWFVPTLLVVAAVALALGLVELDVTYARELGDKRWDPLLNAGAEGARGMLTAIASSMITVAGVAFSVTIVTFSLASTQYTPRILRNFMRDRANQFVLGIFVAIYTYCLVVLRTIRGGSEEDGGGFVPLLSVAVGIVLALISIGCLIFFIHHVATSIQASSILKGITGETMSAIDSLFPEEIGADEDERAAARELADVQWTPVPSEFSGYIQHIDSEALLEFAEKHERRIRLDQGPGDFVAAGTAVAESDRPIEDDAQDTLRSLIVIGDFRTIEQDAGFGIRQIVDIAMKALSPGVNDTSTAVSCVDYLSAILSRLAGRRIASPFRKEKGTLRVIAPTPRFADLLAKSFDEIRLSAHGNVSVLIQMLCAFRRIAGSVRNEGRRGALVEQTRLVAETASLTIAGLYDRQRIDAVLAETREALGASAAEIPPLPVAHGPAS